MKHLKRNSIVIGVSIIIAIIIVAVMPEEESKLISFDSITITPTSVKINQVATITVNIKNISEIPINSISIETMPKFSKNGEYVRIDEPKITLLPLDKGATSGPKTIPITAISPGIKSGTETLIVSVKIHGIQIISKELDLLISR